MILVTGAAGKTGLALLRALATQGLEARALVHRTAQTARARGAGAQQVIVGDMGLASTLERAMNGVRAVYLICPNLSPDEVSLGRLALQAARAADAQHFVYHSVLHPQTEAMPHHWQKLRVEEMIFESGLPFTILQPAAYMQNVLGYWDRIVAEGIYAAPYAVETRLSMVDLEDVAAAAATVLGQAGHVGAIYELAGAEVLSQSAVAHIMEQQLGRPVRAEAMPLSEWEQGARASGLGEYQIDTLRKMFLYYERHGFWANPRVLGWLLGRPPTTFSQFVQRTIRSRVTGGGA